jgi:hypothetical protein
MIHGLTKLDMYLQGMKNMYEWTHQAVANQYHHQSEHTNLPEWLVELTTAVYEEDLLWS